MSGSKHIESGQIPVGGFWGRLARFWVLPESQEKVKICVRITVGILMDANMQYMGI